MGRGPTSSILVTVWITVRIESEIRIHWIIESYQQILMKFYESWGVAQRPTDYILATIHITIRIRESVPDHDLDPGRTATLSTHRTDALQKSFCNSMLVFGGGLCSRSTSSTLNMYSICTFVVKYFLFH